MKWLLYIVASLFVLVGTIAAVGATRPRGHVARRVATFRQSQPTLWNTVRDVANAPSWRSDVSAVEMLPERDGRTMFRERTRHGAVLYRVDASDPPSRFVNTIADETLAFSGSWTVELAPDGGGTRVTITERGDVKNVILRFMSMFFDPGATAERFLRALGRKYGESVEPRPV